MPSSSSSHAVPAVRITGAPRSDGTLAELFAPLDGELIARTVWRALKKYRDGFHTGGCPTPAARAAAALSVCTSGLPDGCDRCAEPFLDVIAHLMGPAREQLLAAPKPMAYVWIAAENAGRELLRKQRAQLGGPCKPDRKDGVASRVRLALGDGWHAQLLSLMLDAATRLQPVSGSGWPLDRFAEARAEATGETREQARKQIPADLTHVLAVAREVAGQEWVYGVVFGGFRGRAAQFGESLQATPTEGRRPVDAAAEIASTEELIFDAVRASFWRHLLGGAGLHAAVLAAVDDLGTEAVLRDQDVHLIAVQYLFERAVAVSIKEKKLVDVLAWLTRIGGPVPPADRRLVVSAQRKVAAKFAEQNPDRADRPSGEDTEGQLP